MESIGPIFTLALSIIGILLKMWADGSPERAKERADEAIQTGREKIMSGDTDSVITRLGSVLDVQAAAGNGNAGSAGSPPDSGRTDTISRLADFGIRNG